MLAVPCTCALFETSGQILRKGCSEERGRLIFNGYTACRGVRCWRASSVFLNEFFCPRVLHGGDELNYCGVRNFGRNNGEGKAAERGKVVWRVDDRGDVGRGEIHLLEVTVLMKMDKLDNRWTLEDMHHRPRRSPARRVKYTEWPPRQGSHSLWCFSSEPSMLLLKRQSIESRLNTKNKVDFAFVGKTAHHKRRGTLQYVHPGAARSKQRASKRYSAL